jgi:hypothetical protein
MFPEPECDHVFRLNVRKRLRTNDQAASTDDSHPLSRLTWNRNASGHASSTLGSRGGADTYIIPTVGTVVWLAPSLDPAHAANEIDGKWPRQWRKGSWDNDGDFDARRVETTYLNVFPWPTSWIAARFALRVFKCRAHRASQLSKPVVFRNRQFFSEPVCTIFRLLYRTHFVVVFPSWGMPRRVNPPPKPPRPPPRYGSQITPAA